MQSAAYGVLFDMDGVLVDSFAAHFQAWQISCRAIGRDCSEEEFLAGFGRTSREVIRETWPGAFSDEEIVRFDAGKELLYRRIISENFPAMPGARELIQVLSDENVPMAIGSSGPPENVRLSVELLQVAQIIPTLITGADVKVGKPHPEVFLKAAQGIGVPPSRCIVFEDAPPGVEAALAAGAKCLGVVSRGRTKAQLHKAHHHVRDLTEVTPALLRMIVDA